MPTALPAAAGPADETSESAHFPSDSEDGKPFLPAPERPWSPSVPAALSTLTLRRYNIAAYRAEQPENANSSSETQPSLSTEVSPQPDTPTPTPPTPASPAKTKPALKSNSFVPSGFVSGVGLHPLSSSDEDSKVSGYSQHNNIDLIYFNTRTGWSSTGERCLCSIPGTAAVTF